MSDLVPRVRGLLYRAFVRLANRRVEIGSGLRIYKAPTITGPGRVSIGRNCVLAGVRGDVSQRVTIDTHEPDAVISIGGNATLCAARITARFEIVIGQDVHIEEAGVADTDFHTIGRTRERPKSESKERCRITVGDRVCIGARSIVTKGVVIGDDVTVAPGSIVAASLKSGCFAMGNPARALPEGGRL